MKLMLPLLFLLIPVLSNCQASKAGSDTLIMPSVNREWNFFEFAEVYKTVVASLGGVPDKIISVENNAPLIAKLTNIENYWFLNSNVYTVGDRINFCDSLQKASRRIFLNFYTRSKPVN